MSSLCLQLHVSFCKPTIASTHSAGIPSKPKLPKWVQLQGARQITEVTFICDSSNIAIRLLIILCYLPIQSDMMYCWIQKRKFYSYKASHEQRSISSVLAGNRSVGAHCPDMSINNCPSFPVFRNVGWCLFKGFSSFVITSIEDSFWYQMDL